MSYLRVIPRDLFNEANLLKCVGKVSILLGNMQGHEAAFNDDAFQSFDIEQDESDGSISIVNVVLNVRGAPVRLYTPLNSRAPWPLWLHDDDQDDELSVFTEAGEFTPEMLAYLGQESSARAEGYTVEEAEDMPGRWMLDHPDFGDLGGVTYDSAAEAWAAAEAHHAKAQHAITCAIHDGGACNCDGETADTDEEA